MNIASAELLQRAAQGTTDALLRRRQLDQQLQEALQRNALESQLRDVQEKRYGAQQEHFATAEAAQADAFKKQQDNQKKQLQAMDDKYNLEKHLKDLESASSNLKDSMGALATDVKAGAQTPEQASGYLQQSFKKLSPELQNDIVAQNPRIQAAMDGKVDWNTLADTYQQSQMGKGKQNTAVGIQYENKAKEFQDQLDAGQGDDESDEDWAKRQQQLQQAVDLNTQLAKTVAGLRPSQTKATKGSKSNPIPGLPPVTNSSTTTTNFGGPTAPAPNVPQGIIPNTAPLPQAAPNPALPSATPSDVPAPGLPKPAAPLPNHVTYLQAHPKTANMFDQQYGTGSAAKYLKPQPAAAQ